jgi:molybdopterin synthase catalytic subunit
MKIHEIIETLKVHPEAGRIGMIATHLGIVRAASRNGRDVTEIEVTYDQDEIAGIIQNTKNLPGIIDVLIETQDGRLKVGEEIMAVAVAGDIRENVFPALAGTVDEIKAKASRKKEFFR